MQPLRIGVMPGVTVSKWSRVWADRRPDVPLVVVPTDEDSQVRLLREGSLDLSFVRLPVDRGGLHLIPLYSEVAVVVVPQDHVVTAVDEVLSEDLADDLLLQDPDSVPAWRDAALARRSGPLPALPDVRGMADTMALVAAGTGLVVVPMSVARLHHRRDLTYRPVTDVEPTQVALAWVAESEGPVIEDFVGVVRGRTARSSRGAPPDAPTTGASGAAAPRQRPVTPRGGGRGRPTPARQPRQGRSRPR